MGGSIKTVQVALGRATLFMCPPENKMSLWDACAPQAILEEAGGVLTGVKGERIDYSAKDTLLPGGILAGWCVDSRGCVGM
jgi:3'-phosphoadenosine 5'-phosphosulfate (PAPS) 3'-phosphatase